MRLTAETDIGQLLDAQLRMTLTSQSDLSRLTGYAEGQISRWVRGKVVPNVATLLRLLAALGYDLALIPREDTP